MIEFPGDEFLPEASLVIDHTRQLPAPPSAVWPWILQLGKDRAGWYLPAAVERFLPPRFRAARRIDPRWQHLSVGERVPDYGGRDEWLEAVAIDAPTVLVYRSERRGTTFTWSLLLTESPKGSIIHLRFRGALRSRGWRRRCMVAVGECRRLVDGRTDAPRTAGTARFLTDARARPPRVVEQAPGPYARRIFRRHEFEPSPGRRRRPVREAALAVAACAIALMVAASAGGSDAITPTTFASAGIDCAASPGATGQVFLKANATDYEIITARLAIASVPGVTIDQYLDHQGAFTQLSCVYPDAPDLVHSIHAVDLPVSFAITSPTPTAPLTCGRYRTSAAS